MEGNGAESTSPTARRKPRKIFLLVGCLLALALAVGLFTTVGTNSKNGPPKVGAAAPTFLLNRVNGPGKVGVPDSGGGNGKAAVFLVFGKWCPQCHSELPPLAAAVRTQQKGNGPLRHVVVLGVDNYDSTSSALSFLRSSGVTFPVGRDPTAAVNTQYYFLGDPAAVFVKADGTISDIVYGAGLTPAKFTALEKKMISS
jgi:AhpC/TSA family